MVGRSRLVAIMHELHEAVINLSLSETGDRYAWVGNVFELTSGDTCDRIGQLRRRLFEVRRIQIGRCQHHRVAFGDRKRIVNNRRGIVGSQNLNQRRSNVTAENSVFNRHRQNTSGIVGIL